MDIAILFAHMETLRRRLEFLIIIALFFPVLISSLLQIGGLSPTNINGQILSWSLTVMIFIGIFIFVEIGEKYIRGWVLKLVNISLLIEIGLFIPVIYFFGMYEGGTISRLMGSIFFDLASIVELIPLLIFLALFINYIFSDVEGRANRIINFFMRCKKR